MNNARRKVIADVQDRLVGLRSELEVVLDEENTAYENLPEGIQHSDRGDIAQSYVTALEDAIEAFEALDAALDEARGETP